MTDEMTDTMPNKTIDDLIDKIAWAGIVGAGGAGFPTAVKLSSSPQYIIVNGVECEPLLQVDQRLSVVEAPLLVRTLDRLVKIIGAEYGVFALKEKHKEAVATLKQEVAPFPLLSIKALGNYYPMGDEQVLVYEVTGRVVPEGGLPIACGVVVLNVETLLNVGLALEQDKPVTEKYVSVVGAVKNPATYKVPVGISYAELITAAGGVLVKNPVMLNGGPMMGRVETDLNIPVSKTSKGIIILNDDHPWILAKNRTMEEMMRISKTACCHCMLCTDICPRYLIGHRLHPDKLMRLATYNQTCEKDEAATAAFLCCECGLCEPACIMLLQPWKLNQELKRKLGALGIKNPYKATPEQANKFRAYRQYPSPKLIQQIGLATYAHQQAPLKDLPEQPLMVNLKLKQHLGAPSIPVVAVGDEVQVGQLVATIPEGALGANIHSSIQGHIKSINQHSIEIG